MASKVWCLLIDDDRKVQGTPLEVSLGTGSDIDDLKQELIQKARNHRLEPWNLTVWRGMDQSTVLDLNNADECVREVFYSGKTEVLDETSKVADLGLLSDEVLLVQVPGNGYNKRKHVEGYVETRFLTKRFPEAESVSTPLQDFYSKSWGRPLNPALTTLPVVAANLDEPGLESELDQCDDVLSGDPFLSIMDTRFLVRAEYIRVFNEVQAVYDKTRQESLAVVTGQPGIGKTLWIYYALRRCLGEKRPVFWYLGGKFYFYSEAGMIVQDSAYGGSDYTWCFVDSTDADHLPTQIYHQLFKLFPIYVTSPKRDRWRKLHQLRLPELIIMNPWTVKELEKAAVLYPERRPEDISDRFNNAGPSARLCLQYSSTTIRHFYADREASINFCTPHHLVNALLTERDNRLRIDDVSLRLCVIYRSDSESTPFEMGPISPLIRRRLLTQLWTWEEEDCLNMIQRFSRIQGAGGVTGLLFESYYQHRFAQEIHINADPLFRTTQSNSRWHATFNNVSGTPTLRRAHQNPLSTGPSPLRLSIKPSKLRTYRRTEQLAIEENVYYVPLADNEVAIDSFIVHHGHLYMFRFASDSRYGVNHDFCATISRLCQLSDTKNQHLILVVPHRLEIFNFPHSNDGFLRDHVPYVAQVKSLAQDLDDWIGSNR